ncbi:MAG: type II secretion system F family protein [Armatimonadetes bacterium]|nr:type II secretion system F family protein [Armatimonadota bacterium]
MSVFIFKAVDENDKVVQGTLHAPSMNLAQLRLRRVYKSVLMLREDDQKAMSAAPVFQMSPRVKVESLAIYTRQMAVMVEAGIAINRALRFVAQGDDQNLNLVMSRVADGVEQGKSLSRAMSEQPRTFGDTYTAMVRAGETSGHLEGALKRLSELLEKTVNMKKRITSTFAYPAVIGVVCIGIVSLFVFYILPMMLPMFASMGVDLPLPTRILIGVVNIFRDPKIIIPLVIFVLVGVWILVQFLSNVDKASQVRYQVDGVLLSLPIAGPLISKSAQARVLYTMASLLEAGVALVDVLNTTESVAGNAVLAQKLSWTRKSLIEGASVYRALEMHDVFGQTALQMVKVGEETGQLSDLVRRIGQMYEDDVDTMLDNMASMLEPLIMAVMGIVVGFVTLASFLPMVNLLRQL